ncbi:MAG: hypothetical protein V7K26_17975 [Nostoc sp.]|uniref:hypothetical protein n=1 Tax=Nostoc sp. TaxID=1180 RepID=UPI002FEE9F5F
MMDIWDLPEETRNIDQQALGYQLVTGDSNTKNLGLLDGFTDQYNALLADV